MKRIRVLRPEDPPEDFPPVSEAMREPDGLLAAGGDLSPERLLAAYKRGIFPWFNDGQPILWWSPDPRSVIYADAFHVSRSLRRTLSRDLYSVSINTDFDSVISACAESRSDTGTWITADMLTAYSQLHRRGQAVSAETWREDRLVGGIYGIAMGGIFFGESMFSVATDASKVAMVALLDAGTARGLELIDCQVHSGHLGRLGAVRLPRAKFMAELQRLINRPDALRGLSQPPNPTSSLMLRLPSGRGSN